MVKLPKSTTKFKQEAIIVHGCKYNYDQTYYTHDKS